MYVLLRKESILIKEERKRAGMTQEQLSDASGVPRRTIQDWERWGVSPVVASSLIAIADALGCTVDSLLRQEPPC